MKHLLVILILSISSYAQSITAPTLTAPTMDKVDVSITADGMVDIIACQFVLYYDDGVLQPIQDDNWGCTGGDLIGSQTVLCNGGEEGTFRVIVYGASSFSGSGTLVTIPFKTVKGDTDLDVADEYFFDNSGRVKTTVNDGGITLE